MFRKIFIITGILMMAMGIGIAVRITAQDATEAEKKAKLDNPFIPLLRGADVSGYPRVTAPRPFSFPADHGPHPNFRLEWWYYTGNLQTESGRHFGYQLTFFRLSFAKSRESGLALMPKPPGGASRWRTNQMYMAHFAITDVKNERFYAFERRTRGALGLAGAKANLPQIWVENWEAVFLEESLFYLRPGIPIEEKQIALSAASTEKDMALNLRLDQKRGKPIVLQGKKGFSQKSAEVGSASYYYSLTRLKTHGTIRVEGKPFRFGD